ncbi:MAG: hypothetical protein RLZZ200_927 [Pseudomonadota bacterium]|jgi:nucleoside transporter
MEPGVRGQPLGPALRARLSLLMFLQYFMFGSWFMTLGTYMSRGLGFDDIIGTAYGTQGIAAILSTLAIGALADRQGTPRTLLALLSAASGALLIGLAQVGSSRELFLAVVTLHFLCFVPTIPLANALVLGCLSDRSGQFPGIRVCGTVGWIVGGTLIGAIPNAAGTPLPLKIAGAAGILMGIYALSLPAAKTQDSAHDKAQRPKQGWRDLLGISMLVRLKDRNFALFIAGMMVILVPLSFYNSYSNTFLSEVGLHADLLDLRLEATAIQTLGQVAELLLLLSLPLFLRRFGIKGVLVMGIFAWSLRSGLFALGYHPGIAQSALLLTGIILHGICYDFFFVAGQIYVDETVSPSERVLAQSFLVTLNMGLGVIIGSNIANAVYQSHALGDGKHDWPAIWTAPMLTALLAGALFLVLFRAPASKRQPAQG